MTLESRTEETSWVPEGLLFLSPFPGNFSRLQLPQSWEPGASLFHPCLPGSFAQQIPLNTNVRLGDRGSLGSGILRSTF